MVGFRSLKRSAALALLAVGVAGCGGSITFRPSDPSATPPFAAYEVQSPPSGGADPMAALNQRPMKLPRLAPTAGCPASSDGTLGFGPGPAYVSGQIGWYSAGQVVILAVDSRYSGPLLVRSSELGGDGNLTVTLADLPPADVAGFAAKEGQHSVAVVSALHTPERGLELQADPGTPSRRAWPGWLSTDGPGCFGLQVDGSTFTEIIVLVVHAGTPPPG